MSRCCPQCNKPGHTLDTRHYTDKLGLSYTTRRRQCKDCGIRWSTREISEDMFKALTVGVVPLERREEYRDLMRKLKMPRAEVLQIMGIEVPYAARQR